MTTDLTLDNFTERTGIRFRVSREQKNQIDAGTLTREQAFQDFLNNGGLDKLKERPQDIPDSVYLDPDLTLENFTDKVEAAIGVRRRFRVKGDQKERMDAGNLTREQALAEIVAAKQQTVASATEVSETPETVVVE